MTHERILITLRTYPQPSARHIETVCTGGITEGLEWRRLDPVPLRYLEAEQQYRTFDVVELDVNPGKDGRPETRIPHLPSLHITDRLEHWPARCDWIQPTIFPSLDALTDEGRSLGPVSAPQIKDIVVTKTAADWSAKQKQKLAQANLFDEQRPLEKVPFTFHVLWADEDGAEHKSLIAAWEILETYRQYKRKYADPIERMRAKWLEDLFGPHRKCSFFMGNIAKRRKVFMVCGWFVPPKEIADSGTLFK